MALRCDVKIEVTELVTEMVTDMVTELVTELVTEMVTECRKKVFVKSKDQLKPIVDLGLFSYDMTMCMDTVLDLSMYKHNIFLCL